MLERLGKFQDLGLLVARLIVGYTFVFVHGLKKITGGPEKWHKLGGAMKHVGLDFMPTFWGFMAAFSEFAGGIFIILGLAFRPSSAMLVMTMAVAAAFHLGRGDGLSGASHAIEVGACFLVFMFVGPGKYSVDARFFLKER